jgi:hypothetical protein
MKYNKSISDYNSEEQKRDDLQRIGNCIFNKKIKNKKDQDSWLRIKEYLKKLELNQEIKMKELNTEILNIQRYGITLKGLIPKEELNPQHAYVKLKDVLDIIYKQDK